MLNTFYAPLKTCEATRQEKLRETIQRRGDQWIEPIGPNHSSHSLPSNLCSSKLDSPYRKSGCDKSGFLLLSKKWSSFAPSTYTTCTKPFWAKSLSSLQRWKTFVVFFFVPWLAFLPVFLSHPPHLSSHTAVSKIEPCHWQQSDIIWGLGWPIFWWVALFLREILVVQRVLTEQNVCRKKRL